MLRLGVLDQSPVRSGGSPADAIRETLALAQATDRLGYHRYWLAEHHSTPALAGPSPEVLIPQVAALTSGIRVGSGGVMLQHYSALKVAESFRVLETLYPGRIDLGIGRAPGSDQMTARVLGGGPSGVEDFPRKLSDLLGFLHGDLPAEHPYAGILAMPTGPSAPEVWLLGSSDQSAILAAHFGAGFSFAHFINADGGARGHARLRAELQALARDGRAPRQRRRLRRVRAHRERGDSPGPEPRSLHHAPLHRPPQPLPHGRRGRSLRVLAARMDDRRARPPPPRGRHAGAVPRTPRGARQRTTASTSSSSSRSPRRGRRACAPTSCWRRRSS